ncbi:MAG: CRISPR-associated helicase Cas3' [Bacteroidales bacterium]|nr:CRISPR-associated helicase Cas3' [Bacteroidales bacterium]
MQKNIYIAHSNNENGIPQTMLQHSMGVAELMRSFSLSEAFENIYFYCGVIHDIGKYSKKFQDYICGVGSREPHAKWGAYFAKNKKLLNVAFSIYGHHKGLSNRAEMLDKLQYDCEENNRHQIEQSVREDQLCPSIPSNDAFNNIPNDTEKELFIRLLYSSLVDADSLDTERHFLPQQFETRPRKSLDVASMIERLDEKFTYFKNNADKTKLNQLRTEVRQYAQEKANLPQGCFSMTLPTGMGKTLCSINWALYHAKSHNNVKRIIIVLPFISIIDQTAQELKSIFGTDIVLEHHSNVICESGSDYWDKQEKSPMLLATENWDYPIVVTTAVQFFESLFSNQRSKCRKLHNIQDSIIIFDEIQTLPVELAECTMQMLNDMLKLCRCSLLFCTATQPDFKKRKDFCGIDEITSLVQDASSIFEQTQRVEYVPLNDYNPQSYEDLARKIIKLEESVLVVCNTKKKALSLFNELKENQSFRTIHLSTNMCPAHRKTIIREIKASLANSEKLIVCSTQLIEAGVDIDFPVVFRELAPWEAIIQSAGRCNREGTLDKGKVFLFQLKDNGQPSRQYETFSKHARLCYQNNEYQLYNAEFYAEYYRQILNLYVPKNDITDDRKDLKFEDVAGKYRIIDSEAKALFVYKYDDESKKLFHEIKDKEFLSRQDYQRISQYCVNVPDKYIKDNKDKIRETAGVLVWHGAYDKVTGLNNENELFLI